MWGDRGLCFLIENIRGDPGSALFFGNGIIILGTILGRVITFTFAPNTTPSKDQQSQPNQSDKQLDGLQESEANECSSVHSQTLSIKSDKYFETEYPLKLKSKRQIISSLANVKTHLLTFLGFIREEVHTEISNGPQGKFELLAAFSDDAIKVLYADEYNIYAIVGNSQSRSWDRHAPQIQGGFRLDRRITANNKFSLQGTTYSPLALIVTSGVTILVNQKEETQLLCPFKLPGHDLIPVDFDSKNLRMMLFLHRPDDVPCVKVFALPTTSEEPLWGRVLKPLFQYDLPSDKGVAQLKFWGSSRIVIVYDYRKASVHSIPPTTDSEKPLFTLRAHKGDFVMVEGSCDKRLLAITNRQELTLWNRHGNVIGLYDISPATFRLGFPYYCCQDNNSNRIAFTSDSGVYLFDPSQAVDRRLAV